MDDTHAVNDTVGVDHDPHTGHSPHADLAPGSALASLVGGEFVEALHAGLRRSAESGHPRGRRPTAGRPVPDRYQAEASRARTAAASPAGQSVWRQLTVSTRQLEEAVAGLPPGHPARDQAVRALTRAIRSIRGQVPG